MIFFSQPDSGLKSESRKSVKFTEKSDLSEFSNLWRSEMLWTSLVTATCLLKQKRLKYHHFSFSHHLFLFTKCLFLCKVMGCHLLAKVHSDLLNYFIHMTMTLNVMGLWCKKWTFTKPFIQFLLFKIFFFAFCTKKWTNVDSHMYKVTN